MSSRDLQFGDDWRTVEARAMADACKPRRHLGPHRGRKGLSRLKAAFGCFERALQEFPVFFDKRRHSGGLSP